jgi:hypothetical protein
MCGGKTDHAPAGRTQLGGDVPFPESCAVLRADRQRGIRLDAAPGVTASECAWPQAMPAGAAAEHLIARSACAFAWERTRGRVERRR